jgi:hypothetical protein
MTETTSKKPKIRYVERPDLDETFADHVGRWSFDGNNLRVDFLVTRLDQESPSNEPTGSRSPVCRLVLTTSGAIELLNKCGQVTAALEKGGLIKKTQKKTSPDET